LKLSLVLVLQYYFLKTNLEVLSYGGSNHQNAGVTPHSQVVTHTITLIYEGWRISKAGSSFIEWL